MAFSWHTSPGQLRLGVPNRALGASVVLCDDCVYAAGGWPVKAPALDAAPASPARSPGPRPSGRVPPKSGRVTYNPRSARGGEEGAALDTDRFLGRFVIAKVPLRPPPAETLSIEMQSPASPFPGVECTALPPVSGSARFAVPKLDLPAMGAPSPLASSRGVPSSSSSSLIVTSLDDRAGHACAVAPAAKKILFFGGVTTVFGTSGLISEATSTIVLHTATGVCEAIPRPEAAPAPATVIPPPRGTKASPRKLETTLSPPAPPPWPQPRTNAAAVAITVTLLNSEEEADFSDKIAKANAAALATATAALRAAQDKAKKSREKGGADVTEPVLEIPEPTPVPLPYIPLEKSARKGAVAAPPPVRDSVECVLLFGGEDGEGGLCDDLWQFNLDTLLWSPVAVLGKSPPARKFHTMTRLPSGSTIALFGGHGATGKLNDLYTFSVDTRIWRLVSSPGAPSPRCMHAAFTLPFQLPSSAIVGGGPETDKPEWLCIFGGLTHTGNDTAMHIIDVGGANAWMTLSASGSAPSRCGHNVIVARVPSSHSLPLTHRPAPPIPAVIATGVSPLSLSPLPPTLRHRAVKWPPVVPAAGRDGGRQAHPLGLPFDPLSMTASCSIELEPCGPDSFREVSPRAPEFSELSSRALELPPLLPSAVATPAKKIGTPAKAKKPTAPSGKVTPRKSPSTSSKTPRKSPSPAPEASPPATRRSVPPTGTPRLSADDLAEFSIIVLGGRDSIAPVPPLCSLRFEATLQEEVSQWEVEGNVGDESVPMSEADLAFARGRYTAFVDGNYVGDMEGGVRHGSGECRYTDGRLYKGTWAEDAPEGEGVCVYANGETFCGQWVDGLWHGKGKWNQRDGGAEPCDAPTLARVPALASCVSYEGEWVDGVRDGQGTAVYVCGWTYEGEWRGGVPTGAGVLKRCEGSEGWEGEWRKGLLEGKGNSWHADGESYSGSFVAGERDGAGACVYGDGGVYEGAWRRGRRNGYGKCTFASKLVYEGKWVGDVPNGKGLCVYPTGHVYDGAWRNGLRHGQGRYVCPDGDGYTGEWRNGAKHGLGEEVTAGGVRRGRWDKDEFVG